MEKLGLNEIRRLFLDFYESKGHYAARSAPLIPQDDKSLLIINSGMAPLKKYFSGAETPPARRMTTCQKCIRTGDIDNVGLTARHGTFFEMLGSFSFGDYFKEESLTWGLEFIRDVLHMPMERIWATVYEEDAETVEIWKRLGMPASHIVPLGRADNFWEIGLGPCGPCSEIFYDRGEAYGCGKPDCKPGCDCDRYIEFWNHVFTQFSREEDGSYSDLAHPNIDTGMGLERIACIMQGVDSIFDVDTIRHILDEVVRVSGVPYEDGKAKTDVSIRIITDHLRSITFMMADGIVPSNEGRGYVLRRLLRRAVRHGRLLGIRGAFLAPLSEAVIRVSQDAYPELAEKRAYIQKLIALEEEKFEATIDQGEEIIDTYMADMRASGRTTLDGALAFKLYDTYGFPLELTEEILAENGYTVDAEGYHVNMERQKEQARAGRRATEEEAWKDRAEGGVDVPETRFTGYETTSGEGTVLAIEKAGASVTGAGAGETVTIYLDVTPFYAESGGQVSDIGILSTNAGCLADVTHVDKHAGVYAHRITVRDGALHVGDKCRLEVDAARRHATARNHTATHLLQRALQEVLGNHVEQAGSSVSAESLRFDFSHFTALSVEELARVETLVNEKIDAFLPVTVQEMSLAEARKTGAMALFGEKYGERVRVVDVGGWSVELCGGTHVANSGQIGAFHILSENGVAAGVRRIEAVTGGGVLRLLREKEERISAVCEALRSTENALTDKALSVTVELRATKKELDGMKKAALAGDTDRLLADAEEIHGVRLLCARFEDKTIADLRALSDQVKGSCKTVAMVFATVSGGKLTFLVSLTDDLVEKGYHAGKMVKAIAAACGGGGGGKADMAQAGAKDPSKLDAAFEVARTLL